MHVDGAITDGDEPLAEARRRSSTSRSSTSCRRPKDGRPPSAGATDRNQTSAVARCISDVDGDTRSGNPTTPGPRPRRRSRPPTAPVPRRRRCATARPADRCRDAHRDPRRPARCRRDRAAGLRTATTRHDTVTVTTAGTPPPPRWRCLRRRRPGRRGGAPAPGRVTPRSSRRRRADGTVTAPGRIDAKRGAAVTLVVAQSDTTTTATTTAAAPPSRERDRAGRDAAARGRRRPGPEPGRDPREPRVRARPGRARHRRGAGQGRGHDRALPRHVQINLSTGPGQKPSETVPNVIGQTLQQALAAINGAHLRLIYLKYPVTSAVAGREDRAAVAARRRQRTAERAGRSSTSAR